MLPTSSSDATFGRAVEPIAAPLVSVVLLTYNHEAYFNQALEGALAQRTNFSFEVIITEDRSTDSTGALVEAAARAHPDKVWLVRSLVNLNTNKVTTRAVAMARGKYIAFLDGDDFWTSEQKLQKQVDLLESSPEVSICFHDTTIVDGSGQLVEPSFAKTADTFKRGGYHEIVRSNYIAGPSPMIRRSAIADLPEWFENAAFGDWPLYMIASRHGSIVMIDEVLAAYRVHQNGYWSKMNPVTKLSRTVMFLASVCEQEPASLRPDLEGAIVGFIVYEVVDRLRRREWQLALRSLGVAFLAAFRRRSPYIALATLGGVAARALRHLRR